MSNAETYNRRLGVIDSGVNGIRDQIRERIPGIERDINSLAVLVAEDPQGASTVDRLNQLRAEVDRFKSVTRPRQTIG